MSDSLHGLRFKPLRFPAATLRGKGGPYRHHYLRKPNGFSHRATISATVPPMASWADAGK